MPPPAATSTSRRRIFVASSKEHCKLAEGIENFINEKYSEHFECDAWSNVTRKSGSLVDKLRSWVREYHLGIFVFAPDDLLQQPHPDYLNAFGCSESIKHSVTRDNVVFELGGWIAFAGIHRAYALVPTTPKVKIPSDLDGVLRKEYNYNTDLLSKEIEEIGKVLAPAIRAVVNSVKANDLEHKEEFFRQSVQELEDRISKEIQQNPLEAVRHLCLSLRNTLTDKVISLQKPDEIENYLKDLLLWVRTSLDALDHKQLAASQAAASKTVWVFAPKPLETESGAKAKDVLRTVAENIAKKVEYFYFVEDGKKGVERIVKLAGELKGALSTVPRGFDRLLKSHLRIVVLKPEHFLSYYTVQFGKGKNPPTVLQSILRDDRQDLLIKLDPKRAHEVRVMIEGLLTKAKKNQKAQGGLTVYSF